MDSMFKSFLKQIRRIPHGKVATYGDIAYAAGHPGSARQVAWALHSSPRGLPWHRVVGAGGKILCTGELGFEQRMRLQQEGVAFIGLRVAMERHHFAFFGKGKSDAPVLTASAKKNAGKPAARKKTRATRTVQL